MANESPAAGATNLPAVADFGEDAGRGMENVDRSEYRVPIIRILQAQSPQCRPVENGGMQGAKAGVVFNTATGEVYDGKEGLDFVPVFRDHNYVEFEKRDDAGKGGGFVGVLAVDDPTVAELRAKQGRFGKLDNGETEIAETFYLYGNARARTPGAHWFPCVVAFTSTQIKKYQNFVTRTMAIEYDVGTAEQPKLVRPPIWAHQWLLQTVFESNKSGDFYGWRLTLAAKNPDGSEAPTAAALIPRNDPRYAAAKDFNAALAGGRAKADLGTAAKAGAAGGAADDEIPF